MSTPLVCSLADAAEIIAERDARIAELEAQVSALEDRLAPTDMGDLFGRVLERDPQAARDAAIRERDEARRGLVAALMAGDWPGTLGTARAEAERRWPGSGEALFP